MTATLAHPALAVGERGREDKRNPDRSCFDGCIAGAQTEAEFPKRCPTRP